MHHKYVPIAVKIAPDLSEEELIQVADSLVRHNIDGVIATNTTLDRSLVQGMKNCDQTGGLSGRPLQLKSTEIIRRLSLELNGRLPIIGVGGIDSVIAAREKIAAGASLVQIYSGFIFKGPPLIKEIVTGDEELEAFLFSLGCYSGETITVVSHLKGGCVVSIKDSRYNIDNQLAQAIKI